MDINSTSNTLEPSSCFNLLCNHNAVRIPIGWSESSIELILPAVLRSWGQKCTCTRNECQEYFRGPGGRRVRLASTTSMIDCLENVRARRLTTLWASTVCYRVSFAFLYNQNVFLTPYISTINMQIAFSSEMIITNSVALVRKRTIPTERQLVSEVSTNFCG
jgi:hypothetical protein